jgi:hypothetical protein
VARWHAYTHERAVLIIVFIVIVVIGQITTANKKVPVVETTEMTKAAHVTTEASHMATCMPARTVSEGIGCAEREYCD